MRDTFLNGGYYKVDFNDDVSLMSINTLEYNLRQVPDQIGPEAEDQFVWLEENLADPYSADRLRAEEEAGRPSLFIGMLLEDATCSEGIPSCGWAFCASPALPWSAHPEEIP